MFLLFFCCLSIGWGQERSIEDLKKECKSYIDSIVSYHGNFDTWFVKTGKRLIEISENKRELDSFNLAGYGFLRLGYENLHQKDSVDIIIKQYFEKLRNQPDLIERFPNIYVNTSSAISDYFLAQGSFYKAYKITLEAQNNTEKIKIKSFEMDIDSYPISTFLTYNLGYIALRMENYGEAERMFRKALSSIPEENISKNDFYSGMGHIFTRKNLDSALYYYKKPNAYYQKRSTKYYWHNNNVSIAKVLIKKGDIDQAEKLLLEAEQFYINKVMNVEYLGIVYKHLAKISQTKGKLEQELVYLKKSEKYLQNTTLLRRLEDLYIDLSNLYTRKGIFDSSYIYTKKAGGIRDSIFGIQKSKAIAEIETKYNVEKKEVEILSQQRLISTQKKQNIVLFISMLILISILVLSKWLYNQKLKTQKELLTNQEALSKEQMKGMLETHKLQSIRAHINGQNKERERIAKDLHDSISGNLATIKLKLSGLTLYTKEIEEIVKSVDSTYKEVRTISYDLVPKKISLDNFTNLLHQLISFKEIEGLAIHTSFFPKEEIDKLPEKTQIEIYRIIQEALTNIHKHSKASKGSINITHHDTYINVIIDDNGVGFTPTTITNGMGLENIIKRVENCNGTMSIESEIQKGTTININIPI